MSTRLALSLALAPGETAFSFMARLAARNGMAASTFGTDMGIPFGAVIDGDPQALARLAALAGVPEAELAAWSPVSQGGWQHAFRGEIFHARGLKETTLRGCPHCLREDAASSALPPEQAMAFREPGSRATSRSASPTAIPSFRSGPRRPRPAVMTPPQALP